MKFLHRADIAAGEAQWVETDRDRLRAATFLDGRERFWTRSSVVSESFAPPSATPGEPAFLFHIGFCGSTWLAKSLDLPGTQIALKEPQCLTDIASQQPGLVASCKALQVSSGVDYAFAHLAGIGASDRVLIKPSNWVNGLLPLLARRPAAGNALFLTMSDRAFLRACFRGGRDRLAFCSRLAALLAHTLCDGERQLQAAIDASDDPLDRAANIVAFLHRAQTALFGDAREGNAWRDAPVLDYDDIVSDPRAALTRAAEHLGFEAAPFTQRPSLTRHAKDESRSFSHDHRAAEDVEVESHHAARFDAALEWADSLTVRVRR